MNKFFVQENNILDNKIVINGSDFNHIKNVLRMSIGDNLLISNQIDKEYVCVIDSYEEDSVICQIIDINGPETELPSKIYLFQGLPKSDKMELIIQKAVELGVYEIIPVKTSRAIVKLDAKKEEAKLKRWNLISESAAKQSKRVIIPKVGNVKSFKEAMSLVKDFDCVFIPYEEADNMKDTVEILKNVNKNQKIAVFIGPEGGFSKEEVLYAINQSAVPITLGKRILRTETAGLMILSVLMFELERKNI